MDEALMDKALAKVLDRLSSLANPGKWVVFRLKYLIFPLDHCALGDRIYWKRLSHLDVGSYFLSWVDSFPLSEN